MNTQPIQQNTLVGGGQHILLQAFIAFMAFIVFIAFMLFMVFIDACGLCGNIT